MPRPDTTMRKTRDVPRLRLDGQLSLRQVALSLAIPHTSVTDCARRAADAEPSLSNWTRLGCLSRLG